MAEWTWIPPAVSGTQVEGTGLLPLGRYRMPDGTQQISFGLPQGGLDLWRSLRQGLGYEQDPNAPSGYVSENSILKGALGGAGAAMTGGLYAGSLRRFSPEIPVNTGERASKMVGYDPRPLPQRPYHDDYPGTLGSHGTSGPLTSPEGVVINAPFVAGRRGIGQGDTGIPPDKIAPLAEALVGQPPRIGTSSELGRDAGRWRRSPDGPGASAPGYEILYSRGSTEKQIPRVVGHEIGHHIDEMSGQIPTNGLTNELKQVYHDLITGQQGRTTKRTGPEHVGYSKAESPREMMAEAIRAYMIDPNYLKTVAPQTAKRIREYANQNPRVARSIQFNAGGVPLPYAGPEE